MHIKNIIMQRITDDIVSVLYFLDHMAVYTEHFKF